ncbi:MAG: hypothetical protein ACM3QU_06590 [Verrucomicrobiota bacterium]
MTYVKAQARKGPIGLVFMIVLAGAFAYLLATVFAGTGGAAPSAAQSKLKYVNVGAEEFQDNACVDGTDYDHGGYSGALNVYNDCTFEAPASLPDGAKIADITAFYSPGTGGSASFHLEANDDFDDHVDLKTGSLPDCGSEFCSVTYTLSPAPKTDAASTHYGIYMPVSPNPGNTFQLYRFRIGLSNKTAIAGPPLSSYPKGTNH